MTKSLADLRASEQVKPQERVYHVCLAGQLVRRVNELFNEAEDLVVERDSLLPKPDENGEVKAPPKRLATRQPPRVKEINDRLEALDVERESLREQMVAESGDLVLRAQSGGEWRRFVNAHPVRTVETDDGSQVVPRDKRDAHGFCDADALLEALGEYVVGWNEELLGKDDWDKLFAPNIAPGDLNAVCRMVVEMHEAVHDVPKLLSGSLLTPPSATA